MSASMHCQIPVPPHALPMYSHSGCGPTTLVPFTDEVTEAQHDRLAPTFPSLALSRVGPLTPPPDSLSGAPWSMFSHFTLWHELLMRQSAGFPGPRSNCWGSAHEATSIPEGRSCGVPPAGQRK